MAKSKGPPPPGTGAASLKALADQSKQQTDLLNKLLQVMRFGPGAAGAGKGPGTPGAPDDKFEKASRRLYDVAQSLSQVGAGSLGRGVAQQTSAAQGAAGLGLPGAAMLGATAGPLGLLRGGVDAAARAAPVLNDSFLTGGQKARALFRQAPLGETIQGYYDAFSGREAKFEKEDYRGGQAAARLQGDMQAQAFRQQFNPQQAGLESRARGLAGASPVLEGRIDRGTSAGEKEFRERQRVLPIEREIAKAQREAAAATAQREASARELSKIEDRGRALTAERARLEKELAKEDGGPKRLRILNDQDRVKQESDALQSQRQAGAQQLASARQAESQAKARVGMGQAQLLRAGADRAEEEAATSAGGARQLGGMTAFDRARSVSALKALKTFGADALFPDQIAAAQSVAPQAVGKILEKRGASGPEFEELRKLAPEDFAGDPEELRRKAQQKRDEAERAEMKVEKTIADESAVAGRELGRTIVEAMQKLKQEAVDEVLRSILKGKVRS